MGQTAQSIYSCLIKTPVSLNQIFLCKQNCQFTTPDHHCLYISRGSRPLGFCFVLFPSMSYFWTLGSYAQSLQKRSEPVIKNKYHLQKRASHLTFSSLGGDKTEVFDFLESALCPNGTREALAKFHFEWLHSAHLQVLLLQLHILPIATSCPWIFYSLPLFKQVLCFTTTALVSGIKVNRIFDAMAITFRA